MSRYNEKEKRTLAVYIVIFILLAAGISISGYLSYHNFKQQFHAQAGHQLSSIAELKVKNLVNWRKERLADAQKLSANPSFALLVQTYFENPENASARKQLHDWLKSYELYDEYEWVRLLDTKVQTRLSEPVDIPAVSPAIAERFPEILQSKQAIMVDFYRRDSTQQIFLALLIPILDPQTGDQVIGFVAISIDPQIYLYPYINEWPIDSKTAETLLVRRQGNEAVFLNNVRFDPNAALTLRYPLTDTELPSVKAVLGQSGVVQAVDYHGQPVLADVRAVPDSPWFLVSKMDIAEVDAPLTTRVWQTFLLVGMSIFMAGAGLMTSWRQQRVQFYRTQAEAAEAVRESEKKYRALIENMQVGVVVHAPDTRILLSNPMASQLLGLTPDQMQGKTVIDPAWTFIREDGTRCPLEEYPVNRALASEVPISNLVLGILRPDREGPTWAQCAARQERGLDGILQQIVVTFFDITERKQAEKALNESERQLKESQAIAGVGSYVLNFSIGAWSSSDVLDAIFGIDKNFERSIAGWSDLIHPSDREQMTEYFTNEVIGKHMRFDKEYRIVRKSDKVECWVYGLGQLEFDAQNQLVRMLGTIQDITDRKRAEADLRESEDKFKYVFDNSVVGKSITLPSGEINVNKAFCEMLGYSREELINRKWQEISHPDDIEITQNIVNSLISGEKESARFTKRYIHKNGSVVWTDVGTAVRRDKAGKPLYFMTSVSDITERKYAEDALRESEDKWRSLVSTTPDYIALHDQEGRFLFLNHYAEGYSEKDVIGNSIYQYFLPESVELFRGSFEKALNTWTPQYIEHKAQGDHGDIRTYEDKLIPMRDKNQGINIMVVSRDITERKKTDEALQASELRLRSVAENLIDIIYEWDLKDTVDWYGDIDGMMGFPNNEFPRTMSGWADMLHPNDRSMILAAVDAQLKHAIPYIVEYRIRRMDDTWRWWSARGTLLRNEHGQPTRWIGSITDITERKRAADALQRSERKYRHLHESMMDGFVSVDMNGNFLECNQVYRNMLGYTEAELTHLTYIDLTPEKWHTYEKDVVQNQIMKRGYSDIYEKEYRRKDGTTFPVELHTVLDRDEYGKPSNMWAIVRDITERKRAEQKLADYAGHLEEDVNERTRELREAQEQLVRQEKLATLGQLAGSMGHELRNPLGIISNAIYFLKAAQPDASAKVREYLEIIEKEARTSDKIITDLLDFTRLKSVDRQVVSVSDMIEQTLNRFPAPESVHVTLNLPVDLPLIFADPHHVVQILGNLTVNAYQAVESKSGRVEITVASRTDMVSIAIHDNGMGIAPENMKKLFEPLFTTKIKGIGLGLAVSKKLTEANDGRIEVESEAGVGSTFTVWLPVK